MSDDQKLRRYGYGEAVQDALAIVPSYVYRKLLYGLLLALIAAVPAWLTALNIPATLAAVFVLGTIRRARPAALAIVVLLFVKALFF